jgi:hypothetical protein
LSVAVRTVVLWAAAVTTLPVRTTSREGLRCSCLLTTSRASLRERVLQCEHPAASVGRAPDELAGRPVFPGLPDQLERRDPSDDHGPLRMWPDQLEGPNGSVMTYSLWRRRDLETVAVPFFDAHPLRSNKYERLPQVLGDRWSDVPEGAQDRGGVSQDRRVGILDEPERKAAKVSGSLGGTLRDCTPGAGSRRAGEDTVRAPWRRGEGGRNDRPPSAATVAALGVTHLPKVAKFLVG